MINEDAQSVRTARFIPSYAWHREIPVDVNSAFCQASGECNSGRLRFAKAGARMSVSNGRDTLNRCSGNCQPGTTAFWTRRLRRSILVRKFTRKFA